RRRDGQPGLEREIDGRRPEEQAEEDADQDRLGRELLHLHAIGDVGAELLLDRGDGRGGGAGRSGDGGLLRSGVDCNLVALPPWRRVGIEAGRSPPLSRASAPRTNPGVKQRRACAREPPRGKMPKPIVIWPDRVLSMRTRPVTEFGPALDPLLEEMM